MIHYFSHDATQKQALPFPDPFRYHPDPLVKTAAGLVMERIRNSGSLQAAFAEGKMLGVLIVTDTEGRTGYLAGFSGNAGGRSCIEGFVPPIYDLLDPSGHFRIREGEISDINRRIRELETSRELAMLKEDLAGSERKKEEEIKLHKAAMAISKRRRDEIRSEESEADGYPELVRQSQHEKAELKRIRSRWDGEISVIKEKISSIETGILTLKERRAEMSEELQKWIFCRYRVHNRLGEEKTIWEIFNEAGAIPPGGTGECAAPKLLEYAFRNRLNPVSMGEFWYGLSPATAVRTEGHFYPSCTSKCGPLLKFMLKGMDLRTEETYRETLETIYSDGTVIAVEKPSGMPSVPGLDGKESAFGILEKEHPGIQVVHRLDMDTSGILIFAKTRSAAACLQSQFESHTIAKTYIARLSGTEEGRILKSGDSGSIDLPLSPDYDERPRQKVDFTYGKEASTSYKVVSVNADGSADVIFHPLNGRTHQLRVHSAHILGLGHPICGDKLYGGAPAGRLMLHAQSITFRHPSTGSITTISSRKHPFPEI